MVEVCVHYSVVVFLSNMFVIKNKTLFLIISTVLVITSIILISVKGLNMGIDFVGGSLTEVTYTTERPELSDIQNSLQEAGFESVTLQPTGDAGLFVKTKDLVELEHQALLEALSSESSLQEDAFTSIGPSIGAELKNKATIALIVVALAIILFIAYVFRTVSEPVSSWRYGLIAVVTLIHDVIITTGAFALLGIFTGAEVDALFVVALLTVLGLSVNDTIVVFDRVRENLRENKGKLSFDTIVGKSLNQTYARSINTSLSTIIVLVALVIFGPESTKMFALTLTFGMFFGTYSSIFLASPLLVKFYEWQKNK